MKYLEMVLRGHPDKIADQISEMLVQKIGGHCAIETMIKGEQHNDYPHGIVNVFICGEINNPTPSTQIRKWVKVFLKDFYPKAHIKVLSVLSTQSAEIDEKAQEGCGDNGVFYGGFDNTWSHIIKAIKYTADIISTKHYDRYGFYPDGKTLYEFSDCGKLLRVFHNQQHFNEVETAEYIVWKNWLANIVSGALIENRIHNDFYALFINPAGSFIKAGCFADCGLTGRKLACDTSLGIFHNGGGAIFGKDISKSDKSIALFLNALAKRYGVDKEYHGGCVIGETEVENAPTSKETNAISYPYSLIKNIAREEEKHLKWYGLV